MVAPNPSLGKPRPWIGCPPYPTRPGESIARAWKSRRLSRAGTSPLYTAKYDLDSYLDKFASPPPHPACRYLLSTASSINPLFSPRFSLIHFVSSGLGILVQVAEFDSGNRCAGARWVPPSLPDCQRGLHGSVPGLSVDELDTFYRGAPNRRHTYLTQLLRQPRGSHHSRLQESRTLHLLEYGARESITE
jgi:hypothetical protein